MALRTSLPSMSGLPSKSGWHPERRNPTGCPRTTDCDHYYAIAHRQGPRADDMPIPRQQAAPRSAPASGIVAGHKRSRRATIESIALSDGTEMNRSAARLLSTDERFTPRDLTPGASRCGRRRRRRWHRQNTHKTGRQNKATRITLPMFDRETDAWRFR